MTRAEVFDTEILRVQRQIEQLEEQKTQLYRKLFKLKQDSLPDVMAKPKRYYEAYTDLERSKIYTQYLESDSKGKHWEYRVLAAKAMIDDQNNEYFDELLKHLVVMGHLILEEGNDAHFYKKISEIQVVRDVNFKEAVQHLCFYVGQIQSECWALFRDYYGIFDTKNTISIHLFESYVSEKSFFFKSGSKDNSARLHESMAAVLKSIQKRSR